MAQSKTGTGVKDTPILVGVPLAAQLLGISSRTLVRLEEALKTPRFVRLGRRRLVPIDEWRAWVDAGCPDRATWESTTHEG